jgi:Ca2+-binding RTX toxin-like protein
MTSTSSTHTDIAGIKAGAVIPAREVLLADIALPDLDVLLRQRRGGIEIRLIDADADGLSAIEAAFAGRPAAVHVLAHGEPGRIFLGRGAIDRDRVATANLSGPGTDLLLYGCEAGAGEAGRALVDALAGRTGGAVAAASRPVGDQAQGGTWDLDVAAGALSTGVAIGAGREGWRHLLAVIDGNAVNNSLTGTPQQDVINGYAGNDTLAGLDGDDILDGGEGDDTLTGGAGADWLDGGDGIDAASYATATAPVTVDLTTGVNTGDAAGDQFSGIEVIVGTRYADTLVGDAYGNVLLGGAGNDTLDGGIGADTLDGGAGVDTAGYTASWGGVEVNLTTGAGVYGEADGDILTGIENVTGSAYNDVLTGDGRANILNGGAGNDTLTGGGGADTLIGGTGDDTYLVDVATDGVAELAGDGTDTIHTALTSYTLPANVENLAYDAGSAFTGTGNGLDNRIQGGSGNDTLTGGAGADSLDGGEGVDIASYAAAMTAITVDLTTGVNTGDAAGDQFSSIEVIVGTPYADILVGDAYGNVFRGGAGNDTLDGGIGADTLDGGTGIDTASYTAAIWSGVDVNLATGTGINDVAEGDVLTGIENVTGSAFNDILTGDGRANVLNGGAGNDTLTGGGGADTLIGGTDDDTYLVKVATDGIIEQAGEGTDTVHTILAAYTLPANVENLACDAGNAFTGTGNGLDNRIQGGNGNDTLTGGAGADWLNGGAGVDVASYATATAAITIDLATGLNTGDAAGDQFSNIEVFVGTAYADTLIGDESRSYFQGGAGDDTLVGGKGADTLDGGAGIDTASYATSVYGEYAGESGERIMP